MGSRSRVRLRDICKSIDYGYTASASVEPVGPRFLRITDIVGAGLEWDSVPFVGLNESLAAKYALRHGNIVLARTGASTGASTWISHPPKSVFASYLVRLAIDENTADSRFVAYWLKSDEFLGYMSGVLGDKSAQPNASASTMTAAPMTLPSLEKQQAISSILGALDDKIELNRKMSRTLDETAQAIFKSWFVNFDGQDLDSEMETPIGWCLEALGDHIDVTRGLSYSGKHLVTIGEGLPLHNLNSVYEGGGYKCDGVKWYSGEYKERHVCYPGDLLVTNTEQGFEFLLIGFPGIVPHSFGNQGLYSHHMYKVEPRASSPLNRVFLYWLLRDTRFHRRIAGFSNGTTVNMLSMDGLSMPRLAIPPRGSVETFNSVASPMLARQEILHDESTSLGLLRDALLPRLLSGELRISDAEKFVEEVV